MAAPTATRGFKLAAPLTAGAPFAALGTPPLPAFGDPQFCWYASSFSGGCERLRVDSVSGQQLVLAQPPRLSHSLGATIVCLDRNDITPMLYGGVGNLLTNDWRAWQRAAIENPGIWLRSGGNSSYNSFGLGQPLLIGNKFYCRESEFNFRGEIWNGNCTQTNLTNDYPMGKNGQIRGYADRCDFDTAAGKFILHDTTVNVVVGEAITFQNPYNEPLPSNIVSGHAYRIKTWNPPELTISEFATPTVELVPTNGASGQACMDVHTPIEVRLDMVSTFGAPSVPDLQASFGPGSYYRDPLYRGGTLLIAGEASSHYNLASGSATPIVLYVAGKDHTFDYVSMNGGFVGIAIEGKGHHFQYVHQETISGPGLDIQPDTHDVEVGGGYFSYTGASQFLRDLTGGNRTSYKIGKVIAASSGGGVPMLSIAGFPTITNGDRQRNTGIGEGDMNAVFMGAEKKANGKLSWPNRFRMRFDAKDYDSGGACVMKLRRIFAGVDLEATSLLPMELWLPDCHNMEKVDFWIFLDRNGKTVTVKDHLGNVLRVLNALGLSRYEKVQGGPTYATSDWVLV